MSASDAAPLPRLGEVFFDVRGDSRSMRLSWYADTDVAVFSIWQGGKCTGTFRLPMDDLSRMIDILQRGPEGRSRRGGGARRPGAGDPAVNAGYDGDNTVVHNPGARAGAANAADYGAGQYGTGDFGPRADDYGPGDHGTGDYHSADRRSADRRAAGPYGPGDYGTSDRAPAEYGDYPRPRGARHRTERYESADYGRPDHERPDYEQDDEWWPDSDHYQADRTGQSFGPADDGGYGQPRFAPPYGRPGPDSSEPGFLDDSEYRRSADPASRPRHSAGRHGGGQAQ